MSILNKNLQEGADEFPPAKVVTPQRSSLNQQVGSQHSQQSRSSSPSRRGTAAASKSKSQDSQSKLNSKLYERFKFNFKFDGVIVDLLLGEFLFFGIF